MSGDLHQTAYRSQQVPMRQVIWIVILASLCSVTDGFPNYAYGADGKCDPDIMLTTSYTNSNGVPMTNYAGMHGTPATEGSTIQVLYESGVVSSYTPGATYTITSYSPGEYGGMIVCSAGNFTTAASIGGGFDDQCYYSVTKLNSHSQTWVAPASGTVIFTSRHSKASSNVRGELSIGPTTNAPTETPSIAPTNSPTISPTAGPTSSPTSPTAGPTETPTLATPTASPTKSPSATSTEAATTAPTDASSIPAGTAAPTDAPSCDATVFQHIMSTSCAAGGAQCNSDVNGARGQLHLLKVAFGCDETVSSPCLEFILCAANAVTASACPVTSLPPKLKRLKFIRDQMCSTENTEGVSDVCFSSPCRGDDAYTPPTAPPTDAPTAATVELETMAQVTFELALVGETVASVESNVLQYRTAIADSIDGVETWNVAVEVSATNTTRRLLAGVVLDVTITTNATSGIADLVVAAVSEESYETTLATKLGEEGITATITIDAVTIATAFVELPKCPTEGSSGFLAILACLSSDCPAEICGSVLDDVMSIDS